LHRYLELGHTPPSSNLFMSTDLNGGWGENVSTVGFRHGQTELTVTRALSEASFWAQRTFKCEFLILKQPGRQGSKPSLPEVSGLG
jgi:hypothetical protein